MFSVLSSLTEDTLVCWVLGGMWVDSVVPQMEGLSRAELQKYPITPSYKRLRY